MKIVLPGVRALVFDHDGRILLQQRADFGSWGLPGGIVDVGDSALDALHREVNEETGLTVVRAEVLGIYTEPRFGVVYPNGDQVQTFAVAFIVRQWTGELSDDDDEVLDVRFFSLDELPKELFPGHRETLEDYRHFDGELVLK